MSKRLGEILSVSAPAAVRECLKLRYWEEVVDERVRKYVEPFKIRNGTLYLSVVSSAWAQELSLLKKEIVRKFNERAGEEIIRDIRFKVIGGN